MTFGLLQLQFCASLLVVVLCCSLLPCAAVDSPCADQLQRCGLLVEEFERQLHDLKNLAFRNCFTNTACVHEKIAFDDCYTKALQAVRAPFGESAVLASNEFLSAAEAFRPRVEQCFTGPAEQQQANINASASTNGGGDAEIASLARVVFGTELADRLWGLPSGDLGKEPLVSTEQVCSGAKEPASRVFGGGISRIVEQSSGAPMTNLNTSCSLGTNELTCFRQALDHDPQHRLLVTSRDRALRSCLQNIRLQPEGNCQFGAVSRQCICAARDELEARMQSALIDCVQHSNVALLYSALISLSRGANVPDAALLRYKPETQTLAPPPLPATSLQISEESLTVPSSSGTVITQGTTLNGQCLCACAQKPVGSSALVSSAANTDYNPLTSTRVRTNDAVVASVPASPHVYRALPAMPWYYQPMQTALSAEAGIANGFERFFNGQPPIRRKKREQQEEGKF